MRTTLGLAGLGLALAATGAAVPALAAAPHNEQVVLENDTNAQADAKSAINGTAQVASYDGAYVVFSTQARLSANDTNDVDDVYMRDTTDGITILVSFNGKHPGNDSSFEPTIDDSGRYIAFTTAATNLVKGDTNGALDVVVKDMYTGKIKRVSVATDGTQGKKNSFFPVISGDGSRVAFQTFSSYARTDADKKEDVYVHDVARGWTRQASLNASGHDIATTLGVGDISDDGSKVTFGYNQDIWVRNVGKGTTTKAWHEPKSPPCQPFPAGSVGRPVISGNGKFIAFSTCAVKAVGEGQYTQVFRQNLATGKLKLVSRTPSGAQATGNSFLPSLSRDGRYVGFGSEATDLVDDPTDTPDPDAFRADVSTGSVVRASQGPDGTRSNNWSASTGCAISGDGQTLVYESYATNLVAGDAYDWEEVFAWRAS